MQAVYPDLELIRREQWERIWPTPFIIIISIGQMLLTLIIIGSETWSMILNIKYAFLFVGYTTALVFTITWISTFTVVCCHRGSQTCATHALVENVLSVIASSTLLYYDAQFLQEPWICLWPGNICSNTDWKIFWNTWSNNYNLDIQDAKQIAIKVQLSCAAIMLALCLFFIVIYVCTSMKVGNKSTVIIPQGAIELRSRQQVPPPPPIPTWSAQPTIWPPPLHY